MNYQAGTKRMEAYRQDIMAIRKKMREALAETEPQEVTDYVFTTTAGPVRLSELFGAHDDLIVVHNMGAACPACTMWADGYNGVHHHIVTRAAFVVSSPDAPAAQRKFAESRGWKFPMVSHQGNTFADDMGYRSPDGKWRPGLSVFRRDGSRILRVSDTSLGPYDDFCSVWHFFDLLPGGAGGWFPKFNYT
jgi:predicted dithiol-disulfide oxidoreductase (DUF899 family)